MSECSYLLEQDPILDLPILPQCNKVILAFLLGSSVCVYERICLILCIGDIDVWLHAQ